ncbi:MAG: alanine racemase [Nitrospirae bacterium]|nr:alanine racemase [Nitrospirota bacterium]
MERGIIAEINLNAVSNNLAVINKLSNERPVIAVVKADAYGHGAVDISRRLAEDGVDYLAVAFTEEARELRAAGVSSRILVLFDPDMEDIFRYDLIPVVGDRKTAMAVSKEAERAGRELGLHIKVDTGMGRLGIAGDAVKEITEIAGLRNIRIDGIMSHFSEADLADASFAQLQISRFKAMRSALSEKGINVKLLHIANSAAVITLPESHFDAVRPGLMLYGYSPLEDSNKVPVTGNGLKDKKDTEDSSLVTRYSLLLQPAMTVKARIIALRRLPSGTPVSYGRTFVTKRESLIGVMTAGYADGFDRRFSNNAEVLVKGKRAPVAGRVCMDVTMIDVTGIAGVKEGDEAVIIGSQGVESIDAPELASRAGTISYEILLSLGSRAKRLYNS